MIVNDERLEVVRFNVLNGTMEVTAESLKANLQSYVNMKTERDTLIDDLKVLREKNEKLEREKKDLHLETNTYFDERLEVIEKYTTLTDHIRLKASANPGEHRYIALVNFIDRLERGEYG